LALRFEAAEPIERSVEFDPVCEQGFAHEVSAIQLTDRVIVEHERNVVGGDAL